MFDFINIPGQLYSSKNNKQIFYNKMTKKPFIAKSNKAIGQDKDFDKILPLYRQRFLKLLEGKEKPYRIQFKIFRKNHIRFDYVNIIQGLTDSMVRCGFLEDDNADIMIPVFEPYEVDKINPRVTIKVL